MSSYNSYTFRLLRKKPSFIGGFASLVDFSENRIRYNQDRTEREADENSIHADWQAIGQDMKKAIEHHAHVSNSN